MDLGNDFHGSKNMLSADQEKETKGQGRKGEPTQATVEQLVEARIEDFKRLAEPGEQRNHESPLNRDLARAVHKSMGYENHSDFINLHAYHGPAEQQGGRPYLQVTIYGGEGTARGRLIGAITIYTDSDRPEIHAHKAPTSALFPAPLPRP